MHLGFSSTMFKKKIVLIHHSGLLGGAGISLYYTWLELAKKYEVSCYVPDDPPELKTYLETKGLKPKCFSYRLGKITYYSGGNGLKNPKFWYHMFRVLLHKKRWEVILDDERPDLVIVNAVVLCWFAIFAKKYKLMCFVRETVRGDRRSWANRFMAKLLEKFSLVSFLSNYDRNNWNLTHPQSIVTHNSMERSDFEPKLEKCVACAELSIKSDPFNVLFLGGMNKLKGTKVAVQSMAALPNENIHLIIAGNNPGKFSFGTFRDLWNSLVHFNSKLYFSCILQQISSSSLKNRIHYIGVQSNVRVAFDACDVLIIPMVEPHQARPVFEFGVQKKPVIISDFDNVGEFIVDDVNGLTFRPNDHVALSQCVKKLYQNRALYSGLGHANYQNAITNHDRIKVMSNLILKISDNI
jgi:glycosyltransferase involved in cell wall biosynthesis